MTWLQDDQMVTFNWERKILHVDMDAFYAAIEQMDHPFYRGQPVIVGGDPHGRGVVATCSYEARKFGVHSAMPLREAFRKCPQGIFVPPRGWRYAEVSECIMKILAEYSPVIEPLSLDEAFLDLSGSEQIFGPAVAIARTIVRRIKSEVGLEASIGLGPNKFLAKLGSDLEKPQGFVVIAPENAAMILENLPVRKLWGVGRKTERLLQEMGIHTIGQLRNVDLNRLTAKLGEIGTQLYHLAHGKDERPVIEEERAKSIGREITFPIDTDQKEFLGAVLLGLGEHVARQLRRHGLKGRVIAVKIRNANFKTMTRQVTLSQSTDFEERIYQEALRLANEMQWGFGKVRLLGVSVSGFNPVQSQLGLFSEEMSIPEPTMEVLHRTIDGLKDKFGEHIITKATILSIRPKRAAAEGKAPGSDAMESQNSVN